MAHNKLFYIAHIRLPTEKAHGMQIMKSCEALARAGVEVELVVPRRKNPIADDPFTYYAVEKNFTLTKIPYIDTVRFGRVGFLFAFVSFLIASRVYLIGKKGFIYTREEGVGLFFRRFALETHMLSESMGWLRNLIYRRAKVLFVLTSFIKAELTKKGVSESRLVVAPDAVDLKQFDIPLSNISARERVCLPQGKQIVLYAGSFFLYDWKGVDTFLEAAKEFGSDTLFVLVGGNEKEVNNAKAKWGRENVSFLGYQPPQHIPVYLKAADVLVIPNKKGSIVSEQYTSPLKLFEYMAAERPIVASRLPSLEEVVGEDEVLFFEPNNVDDLSLAIRQVLRNKSFAEILAKNSRKKAEKFTWDTRMGNVLAKLREFY